MTDIVNKITSMFPKSGLNGFNGLLGDKPLETKHIIMIGVAIFVIAGLIYLIYNWSKTNVEAFHANRENIPISENESSAWRCSVTWYWPTLRFILLL